MSAWDRQPEVTGLSQSTSTVDQGLRGYMLKVYNYMASALLVTGLVAYFAVNASVVGGVGAEQIALTEFGQAIFIGPLHWVIIFAPLVMCMVMGVRFNRMSTGSLQACFWAFSAIMGLSMASIALVYTGESIARTFFITAAMFGGMSIFGYSTKRDLTGVGHFLIMGVWGMLIASVVNIFLQSSALSFTISIVGVVAFTGLIAYDTQKLKGIYYSVAGSADAMARSSIMGALNLYLDFINLFISMMRLMGDRR